MQKILLQFLTLFLLFSFPLLASSETIGSAENTATIIISGEEGMEPDDLILADVPILYGEDSFRERILERTEGKRDPIGLVLTGGSARAFAHLGVLKYLEEIGIEPDFIISNSMGAIIAMLYGAGLSPSQIMSVITSGDLSAFFTLTIPVEGGILEPSGFRGLVESIVGADLQLEDLAIPVMVISQDLVTKREVRIMEGSFSDILSASFALPAYFPPQEFRGHLLIDGGIINLAPISTAYQYSDTVIVSTTFYDNDSLNLKNVLNILNTSFEIVKRQNAAADIRAYQDRFIWIRCAVEHFSFMDFGAAEELAEIGYESAKEQAEVLSTIYKHGLSPQIEESRKVLQYNLDKAIVDQYYFSRVEQPRPSNTLSLGFYTFQDNEYPYYLRNTFDVGLEYSWTSRKMEVSFLVGGAYNAMLNESSTSDFMISGSFMYFPVSQLRFSLYGVLTFQNDPFYIPTAYLRQGFDYKIYSSHLFAVEFNEAFEMYQNFQDGDKDQYMFLSQIQGYVNIFDYARVNLSFGYMGTLPKLSAIKTTLFRQYLQVGADTRLYILPQYTNFFLDLELFSRFAVDDLEGVPIYASDGFLTNDSSIYDSQISATSALASERDKNQSYFILVPLSFGYAFTAAPSFGELLMADYLEVSLYCDLLFNKGLFPAVSAGIELQFELSLIGLQSIPFTFRLGYDGPCEDLIFSLRFSVTK